MKKQTIFDLSSMPKMVLIITLVVMLGSLFGAVSYLLKTPKTDSPIIDPVVEAQCEIDSDCELVYTGSNICLPCDTSTEEYKCLLSGEAEKIEEKRFKRMFNTNTFCERCLEKPQHNCVCENGKCEKVKEEIVEKVIITTDKIEYETGETVSVIIENNFSKEIFISYPIIERIVNDDYISLRGGLVWSGCGVAGGLIYLSLEPYEAVKHQWDQKEKWCSADFSDRNIFSKEVLSGKYRIKSEIIKRIKSEEEDPTNVSGKPSGEFIYSNEFTIREKSAVDARCGEEVEGRGYCRAFREGYEFDSVTEKCIKKGASGCSFNIPFKTLEECQEVCEKDSIIISDRMSISLKTIIENKYKSGNSNENIEIAIMFIKKPTESQLIEIQNLSNRELVKLFENVYSTSASAKDVLSIGNCDFIEKIEYFGGDIILE